MPAPVASAGYSRPQIVLHWVVALLILWQFLLNDAIAKAWEALGKGEETGFNPLVLAHVLVGAAVLIGVIWRLAIKARRKVSPMADDNALLDMVARLMHLGLYALMILMPVSGAIAWFAGVEQAANTHKVLKFVLLALIALHIVGALYHQFILKDDVMDRMKRAKA